MTQLFNPDGTTTAVTVLEAGPCHVLGLRTAEKDGYAAARIRSLEKSRTNKLGWLQAPATRICFLSISSQYPATIRIDKLEGLLERVYLPKYPSLS